jgi:hypothetical protein
MSCGREDLARTFFGRVGKRQSLDPLASMRHTLLSTDPEYHFCSSNSKVQSISAFVLLINVKRFIFYKYKLHYL